MKYPCTDKELMAYTRAISANMPPCPRTPDPAMQQALDELRQIMDEYLRQKEEEDLVTLSGVEV